MEEVRREMLELRQQLDRERSARMQLEEQVRCLSSPDLTIADCVILRHSSLSVSNGNAIISNCPSYTKKSYPDLYTMQWSSCHSGY